MTDQFADLKQHIQHEVDMQIVAATSPLGWKVVNQMELGRETTSSLSVSSEEVRKAEKEKMSYDKDLRLAKGSTSTAPRGAGGSRRGRGRARQDEVEVESPPKRGRGNARGGRGGVRKPLECYRCGKGHKVENCKKPYAKN